VKTINKDFSYTEIIKKSKFLTFLHPITTQEQAKTLLEKYKKEYSDATHICYAYILDENTFKYYDDGEPTSSAGIPIYQALKNNNVIYTLAVVIRYFGGTKLGVGGLTRAYSSGVLTLVTSENLVDYKKLNEYLVEMPYSLYDSFMYHINNKGIALNDKQFLDTIFISLNLDEETLNELKDIFPTLDFILSK
jgi:uncharacterized YigZ family protein